MRITVFWGGEPREVEANENLDQERIERKGWCENELATFFRSTRCGIKHIDYYSFSGEELLRIYYDEKKDCYKDAWITGDSYAAIVEDMFRQRRVY